jgi:phosphatidylserine/phosphatidylglycerophosphate/cardiolipin synthase-like enzyme
MGSVGTAEAKWLLQFTSTNYGGKEGDGRPWGDGTAMAKRAATGLDPWDDECAVSPMLGGDATMIAIREDLELAIAYGEKLEREKSKIGPGARGHVYLTGLQFNGLRDLSSNNPWGGNPWQPGQKPLKDQTALGLVLRLMSAGIGVRMLLWMPNGFEEDELENLAFEHRCMAAAVQDHNAVLEQAWNLTAPIGVVALDLRTGAPEVSSLHQKMIAIRIGNVVNSAYCGGVDLAFTRRDFGLGGTQSIGTGDWQSANSAPSSPSGWPRQEPAPKGGYPKYPFKREAGAKIPPELDTAVYGPGYQHWHDHHLRLEGPIVATLEQQFVERWGMDAMGGVEKFNRDKRVYAVGQVLVTSGAYVAGKEKVAPLPPAAPAAAIANGQTVQMWRTIPLRAPELDMEPPFVRGEFTVMAGVSKAVLASTKLITICDQYFWSLPLARLLAARVREQANLKLLIILPPFGSTVAESELPLRYAALQVLWQELGDAAARSRVMVRDIWSVKAEPKNKGFGVYVHAKCHTYDEMLYVCGSANMNRRSLQCDAELDCAVLGEASVQKHLAQLYECLTEEAFDLDGDFLATFWEGIATKTGETMVADPFFAAPLSAKPKTRNGVNMPYEKPTGFVYGVFEPTSIKRKVDWSTCPKTPGDPGKPGRLDEITFLLERCCENGTWPMRQTNAWSLPEITENEPEGGDGEPGGREGGTVEPRMPRLIL